MRKPKKTEKTLAALKPKTISKSKAGTVKGGQLASGIGSTLAAASMAQHDIYRRVINNSKA